MQFGLLGKKLGHSYSPLIHKALGSWPYELCEKSPEQLSSFLEEASFRGLNVTIPYKKDVIPFCKKLSPAAQAIGAVNTLVKQSDGSLIGHNTDYFGFKFMVDCSGLQVNNKKVLVLGTGGASLTVQAVLKELKAEVIVISRSGENNYTNLSEHKDASVIINATPVGMYPNTGISPVSLDLFPHLEGVLDIVYNPARTQLLMDAEEKKLTAVNGLWMLVAQAWESAQWFLGKEIPKSEIYRIHKSIKSQAENIILIGMPGSGKSTLGKLLSEKTGKKFIDSDEEIVKRAGMSIPEIFRSKGEAEFRAIEIQVLKELGMQSGLIIATGGGCVTRKENYVSLHQNGTIFWLQRDIHNLPTEGRPLSQTHSLQDMYAVRYPLYDKFGDAVIDNNRDPEMSVHDILSWEENQ